MCAVLRPAPLHTLNLFKDMSVHTVHSKYKLTRSGRTNSMLLLRYVSENQTKGRAKWVCFAQYYISLHTYKGIQYQGIQL